MSSAVAVWSNDFIDRIDKISNGEVLFFAEEQSFLKSDEENFFKRLRQNANSFFNDPISFYFSTDQKKFGRDDHFFSMAIPFRKIGDKISVLEVLQNAFALGIKSESIRSDLLLVSDEFFTNAIYNAPFQERNGQKLSVVDRSSPDFLLNDVKQARLWFAYDEDRIFLACQDYYGSLNPTQMIERIYKCINDGVGSAINWGQGGAGIGSFMIYKLASSMIIAVQPGISTIVGAVFPRRMSQRRREHLGKSMHIYKGGQNVKILDSM